MKTPWGQLDVRHLLTGIVGAVLLGGGSVIWGLIKPEPDRAVEMALIKRDVADLKSQNQRIEDSIAQLREELKKRR